MGGGVYYLDTLYVRIEGKEITCVLLSRFYRATGEFGGRLDDKGASDVLQWGGEVQGWVEGVG